MDERFNDKMTLARNAFETAIIQAARLSAFIVLSPLWRSHQHQNQIRITSFAVVLAKQLMTRFTNVLSLTSADYAYICLRAVMAVWHWSTPERRLELNHLDSTSEQLKSTMSNTNEAAVVEWNSWDVKIFDNYDIDASLQLMKPGDIFRN